jgi:hypothetical protein
VARALLVVSAGLFAVVGIAYLAVPGMMLSVVGVESTATTDFLLRTEGVALLAAAGFLWAIRDARPERARIALAALAAYYFVGSFVDLVAFAQGVVEWPSVPSAGLRILLGAVCALTALRLRDGSPAP